MKRTFLVTDLDGSRRTIELQGRSAWALSILIDAGDGGSTSIDNPTPRWSGYVHKLRHEYGLGIETVHESHGGPFPGTHARYVLKSRVRLIAIEGDQEAA